MAVIWRREGTGRRGGEEAERSVGRRLSREVVKVPWPTVKVTCDHLQGDTCRHVIQSNHARGQTRLRGELPAPGCPAGQWGPANPELLSQAGRCFISVPSTGPGGARLSKLQLTFPHFQSSSPLQKSLQCILL